MCRIMTEEQMEIVNEIETLVCDFDKNVEKIKSILHGENIDLTFGQQLIYADALFKNCRQRRMLMFDIMLHESVNLQNDWGISYRLIKEAYIMTDNIYAQVKLSPYSFNLKAFLREMSGKINVVSFMEQEELDYLASLPFPMKAYRGMCNAEYASGDLGISWTDSKDYASNYVFFSKNNNREKDGKIAERTIERKDVFAAWGVNGNKKELIILT